MFLDCRTKRHLKHEINFLELLFLWGLTSSNWLKLLIMFNFNLNLKTGLISAQIRRVYDKIHMHCAFVLLLGHWCEDLLHLFDDAVQLVWVFFYNLLDGVTHWWLDKSKVSSTYKKVMSYHECVQRSAYVCTLQTVKVFPYSSSVSMSLCPSTALSL